MAAKLSGSSGKKYAIEQNADINVTPFVDVMLVLLIIFMVAAPLATQSLKLDLPPPIPPKDITKKIPFVLLQIQDNGQMFVGVKDKSQYPTNVERLPADLARVFNENGIGAADQKVSLTAGSHVTYGTFMGVMNALEVAGYNKINLVIQAVRAA